MSNHDVKTGDPLPQRRYQVCYRTRPMDGTGDWGEVSIDIVSRSPAEAIEIARQTVEAPGPVEFEIISSVDVTDLYPCGHPRIPGDDICSGLHCNSHLLFE